MTGDWNRAGSEWRPKGCCICACLAVMVFLVSAAVAQDAQPEPQAPPFAAPPQLVPPQPIPPQGLAPPGAARQAPAFQPGFLDALGRWIGDSKSKLDEQLRTTTDAAKDAAGAAGQATDTILGLPATRVVLGRERCPVATNGGADCAPAANALCRSKGFAGGRGLDINSAQKCPSWVWLSGRQPPEGSCPTETFVTRAVCH